MISSLLPVGARSFLLAALFVFAQAASAAAVPILVTGTATGSDSTASGTLTFNAGVMTLELTNTSPFDARITGIGFDLASGDFSGNSSGLNGFAGNSPAAFSFTDGTLGNVPQFNSAVLDFGWITGNSGNFNGGSAKNGMDQNVTLTFTVSGLSLLLSEEQLAEALFVRFQRVGLDGKGSDVGIDTPPPPQDVPEPTSMWLIGAGLAAAVVRRRKRTT